LIAAGCKGDSDGAASYCTAFCTMVATGFFNRLIPMR
jgi:hypothetical protein